MLRVSERATRHPATWNGVRASRRFQAVRLLGAAPPEGEGEAEAIVHAQRAVDGGAQERQEGQARRDERGVERGAEGLEKRETSEIGRLV